MDPAARLEALLDTLHALAEANEGAPILVEGARDVAALRAFGCRGDILAFQAASGLAPLVEALAHRHRRVLLLPDWDARGARHARELAALCAANGIVGDRTYWERIPRALGGAPKDVESLLPYVAERLERHRGVTLDEHVDGRREAG